jgi:hypothetical protein
MTPPATGQPVGVVTFTAKPPETLGVLGKVRNVSATFHPEPVTVTVVPTGPEVVESVAVPPAAAKTGGSTFERVMTMTLIKTSMSTSDSFLRLLVNSRILQYLCNTQREGNLTPIPTVGH